jgi:hypothetical protein
LGTQRYYLYLRKESKKGEKITIQNVEFKIQNERKRLKTPYSILDFRRVDFATPKS